MKFLEALRVAVRVIREQDELDEIYLYEPSSQMQIYLKNCEGNLEFMLDESLPEQIYLASFLDKRLQATSLSLKVIFSKKWEVRLRKIEHLRAIYEVGSIMEKSFMSYTPVSREREASDV